MLSSFIKPIMEDWWKSKTKLFFGLKLLKMWNSHLPPLRCKSQTGQMVSPLSSFHLVLLCMAAAPDWQSEMTLQDTCHLAALCVPASLCAVALDESTNGTRRCTNRWGTR
ncbi:unnamed protein product [Cladocopium goreaui]|uniref:Uncharacterized protein n=1 Tax=Cladocopium goreaui TaxID=2562237 RepID=A0A9P1CHT3_9DINO|nr:unnamed protein product [Cladocopium goreaui]